MIYLVANNFSKTNVRFKNPMLRSDSSDYSTAYIVVKGRISCRGTNNSNTRNKKLPFENDVNK